MNALDMLRLIEITRENSFQSAGEYVAKLLHDGIDEAIKLGRPWVTIHTPIWCLEALRKEADSRGFNFREQPHSAYFQIREVTMSVKTEISEQYDYELAVKGGKV